VPIHDVGYRPWPHQFGNTLERWWVIAQAGIRTNFKSTWVRRLLFVAALPVLYWGILFFAFEKYMENAFAPLQNLASIELETMEGLSPEVQEEVQGEFDRVQRRAMNREVHEMFQWFPGIEPVLTAIENGQPNEARHAMWSSMLMIFFRYPQGVMLLLLVGMIAPPLVARDVRSRAFLLYYARPIGQLDYILGKLAVPAVFVMLITTVPALFLFFIGVMLSPDLSVLRDTWDLPFRILMASAVLVVPTCSLALMFSSLTNESRFAGFAWFAVWGLGAVAWGVILAVKQASLPPAPDGQLQLADSQWSLLSIYSTLGKVQTWVFGLETDFFHVLPSLVMLGGITLFSLIVLYRRVSAPIRV